MTKTEIETAQADGETMADRAMQSGEPLSWREAGYASAIEAAHVIIGDAIPGDEYDREVHRVAAEIVAAETR